MFPVCFLKLHSMMRQWNKGCRVLYVYVAYKTEIQKKSIVEEARMWCYHKKSRIWGLNRMSLKGIPALIRHTNNTLTRALFISIIYIQAYVHTHTYMFSTLISSTHVLSFCSLPWNSEGKEFRAQTELQSHDVFSLSTFLIKDKKFLISPCTELKCPKRKYKETKNSWDNQ